MKVYLAGKITGDPNYREKFAEAAKKLEERAGVTVISPAVTPEGLKKADYMRICFAMLESDRHGGKYHTNYIVCRRCGKLCYRMRRRREKTI